MAERVNTLERRPERAGWAARPATGIQSVELGTALLRALADGKGPLSLTALATASGMAPGKAHKYLVSYIRAGLATQKVSGGPYDLGPLALELGLAAMRRMDVMAMAQAALDDLRDRLGTMTSMAVWANHGPTIVRWAETPHIMSLTIRIGTVMPLLTSGFGRVFAAFLDRRLTQETIQAEIADPDGPAARAGLRTLADVDSLLAEFRSRRMTAAEDLVDPGRAALGAPIFDHNDRVVAAIAVIGVQGQLDISWEGKPARELALCVQNLSRRLGAQPHLFA